MMVYISSIIMCGGVGFWKLPRSSRTASYLPLFTSSGCGLGGLQLQFTSRIHTNHYLLLKGAILRSLGRFERPDTV